MDSLATTVTILNNIRLSIFYTYYVGIFLGIIGHILNILVLTQLKLFRNNRWVLYLVIESVVDIVYCIIISSSNILQIIYPIDPQGSNLVWCRIRSCLFQTCTLTSSFTICIAACDQFFSTTYRLNVRQMCTFKLAQCIIVIGFLIWLIHSVIFSFYLNINPPFGCVITNSVFLEYSSWFFYPVLYGPLEVFIAATSSLLAFQNVRRIVRQQVPIIRRRLDQQMTAMILVRALFYVIFSLPYSVYRVIIINRPYSQLNVLENSFRQLLVAAFTSWTGVNFIISFYIFIAISARYRHQVRYLLVKKYWRRLRYWFSFDKNQIVPTSTLPVSSSIELE